MHPLNPTPEIPLEDWALQNDIPARTAKNWARERKIAATLRTVKVPVNVVRRVKKYFIVADTPKPESVN